MVCDRCIRVVGEVLREQGMTISSIQLGLVTLEGEPDERLLGNLGASLRKAGFELQDDPGSRIIETIRLAVIDWVHHGEMRHYPGNFSDFLSGRMHREYGYLSSLFSRSEQVTIEQYLIRQKVERVKELIQYGEMNLSQIADELRYSSVAHLSGQFRKMTGMTAGEYRKQAQATRRPLDQV